MLNKWSFHKLVVPGIETGSLYLAPTLLISALGLQGRQIILFGFLNNGEKSSIVFLAHHKLLPPRSSNVQ